MIAEDFTRHGCRLGGQELSYAALQREYRCNECGGRPVVRWDEGLGYHAACGRCGAFNFIHQGRLERERAERVEVVHSLPPHIARRCLAKEETMPIKDRERKDRLTRAGIIRLGYRAFKCRAEGCGETIRWEPGPIPCPSCGFVNKVDQRYTFPVAADHFVLRDAPEIQEHYGPHGEPVREIDVLMLFPDVRRNFDASYQIWAGGVIVCEGDGERVRRARPMALKRKDGRLSVQQGTGPDLVADGQALRAFKWGAREFAPGDFVPCPGTEGIKNGGYPQCEACRMGALLRVAMAVPELFRYAYYQLATGSWRNYETILAALQRVRGDHQDPVTGEELVGTRPVNTVRFKLRLEQASSAYFDERSGKVRPTDKYFLEMEPYREDMLRIISAERQALLGASAPRMLPPADVEEGFFIGPDEAEFLADEELEFEPPAPPPHAEVEEEAQGEAAADELLEQAAAELGAAPVGVDPEEELARFLGPRAASGPAPAELPAWAQELRRRASQGAGASDPVQGSVTGLIVGWSRKLSCDRERVRAFLRALWGCEPEEMTRAMYGLTVDLNGELAQRVAELEAALAG